MKKLIYRAVTLSPKYDLNFLSAPQPNYIPASLATPPPPPPHQLPTLTWNQMLFIGLLIQKIGRTQNPVKVYDKMTPSQGRMPDSEGSLIIPVATRLLAMTIYGMYSKVCSKFSPYIHWARYWMRGSTT